MVHPVEVRGGGGASRSEIVTCIADVWDVIRPIPSDYLREAASISRHDIHPKRGCDIPGKLHVDSPSSTVRNPPSAISNISFSPFLYSTVCLHLSYDPYTLFFLSVGSAADWSLWYKMNVRKQTEGNCIEYSTHRIRVSCPRHPCDQSNQGPVTIALPRLSDFSSLASSPSWRSRCP